MNRKFRADCWERSHAFGAPIADFSCVGRDFIKVLREMIVGTLLTLSLRHKYEWRGAKRLASPVSSLRGPLCAGEAFFLEKGPPGGMITGEASRFAPRPFIRDPDYAQD